MPQKAFRRPREVAENLSKQIKAFKKKRKKEQSKNKVEKRDKERSTEPMNFFEE